MSLPASIRDAFLFASGGKVDESLAGTAERLARAGGLVCNRLISDEEMLDFYSRADLIWCVYAPDYDQASGILGRAMQLGIPVAVREGSLIERLCEMENHGFLAWSEQGDPGLLLRRVPKTEATQATRRAQRHARESVSRLVRALGIEPREGWPRQLLRAPPEEPDEPQT